jgi:hypothetical protein
MRSVLLGFVLAAVSVGATANETSFRIDGVQGDFVTQGRSFFYTPETAGFYWYIDDPFHGVAIDVSTASHDFDAFWYASFANADHTRLLPGLYPNAVRYRAGPYGQPWLAVTSSNGCNQIAGEFEVLLATYAPNGDLVSFWATFSQSCDGGPFVTGEVKINVPAGVAASVPTLGPAAMAGLALMLGWIGWSLVKNR